MSGFTFDGKLLCREVYSYTLTYGFVLNCYSVVWTGALLSNNVIKMLNLSVQLLGGKKSDLWLFFPFLKNLLTQLATICVACEVTAGSEAENRGKF